LFQRCRVCGETVFTLFNDHDVCSKCGARLSSPPSQPVATSPSLTLPQRKNPSLSERLALEREKMRHNRGVEGSVDIFFAWQEELARRSLDVPLYTAAKGVAHIAVMLSAAFVQDPSTLGKLLQMPVPFFLHAKAFLAAGYPLMRMNLAICDNPEDPVWVEAGLDIRDGDAQEFFEAAVRNESLFLILEHEKASSTGLALAVEAAGLANLLQQEIPKVLAHLPRQANESDFRDAGNRMQRMLPNASSEIVPAWTVPLRRIDVSQASTQPGSAAQSQPKRAPFPAGGFSCEYEGVHYSGFMAVEPFLSELRRSRCAMLRSTFADLPQQLQTIFAGVSETFGTDSQEAHRLMESRLFCGGCNAAFRQQVLTTLVVTYLNTKAPLKCPKCASIELILMTQLGA